MGLKFARRIESLNLKLMNWAHPFIVTWTLIGLFIPFWLACYGYAIRFMWHALAPIARTKFSFYITDLWVAMLCLAPTLSILAKIIQREYAERDLHIVLLLIFTISQVFGIILGRIFSFPRDGERMPRRVDQALWVVVGTVFFGIVGLVAVILGFLLCSLPVMIVISCPPAGLWVVLFVFLMWRSWMKSKAKLK